MAYGGVLVHTNGPSYGQNIVRNVGVSSGGGGGGAPDAHAASHEDGGADELDLTGLSGGFQNPFPDPVEFQDVVDFLEDLEMRDNKRIWFDTAKTHSLSFNQGSVGYVFEASTPDVYLAGVAGIALQGNVGVDGSGTFSNYILLDDEGRQIYSAKYTDLVENPSELELYQWLFGGSMLIGADLLLGKGANVFNRPNLVGNGLGPWVMDKYATVWIEGEPAVFDDFSITVPAALRIASGLAELGGPTVLGSSLQLGVSAVAAAALVSTHKLRLKDTTGAEYDIMAVVV